MWFKQVLNSYLAIEITTHYSYFSQFVLIENILMCFMVTTDKPCNQMW